MSKREGDPQIAQIDADGEGRSRKGAKAQRERSGATEGTENTEKNAATSQHLSGEKQATAYTEWKAHRAISGPPGPRAAH